jgi:hypothetical protein
MIWNKDVFAISDDKNLLDTAYILDYLSKKSYWAANIPVDVVKKSMRALCVLDCMMIESKSVLQE